MASLVGGLDLSTSSTSLSVFRVVICLESSSISDSLESHKAWSSVTSLWSCSICVCVCVCVCLCVCVCVCV